MRVVDIIHKKRNGSELTELEIKALIDGYSNGDIPDYQMSSWAMAVYFQGMTAAETAHLTMAMAYSGDTVDLSPIDGVKVDKHSTGGVGDKTTLIVVPIVAAAGIPVAKMSGRGLGHTGGTIDKLESISGFRTELAQEQFFKQVKEIGLAVIGQSGNLTPADKKLYALRDVTATVESIPLVASSVMSKKIAAGADAIVLDVKTGSGAFMKTLEDSEKLARAMVEIGTMTGRNTAAVISDMDQPLGYSIGNALEVAEAVQTLQGHGPADLTELSTVLAAHMVVLAGKAENIEQGKTLVCELIESGAALAKFRSFVQAQGGDDSFVDNLQFLPQAKHIITVPVQQSGYISRINAEELGIAAMLLGAGRATKDDVIDHSVGVVLRLKVGDRAELGTPLADVHAANMADTDSVRAAIDKLSSAFEFTPEPPAPRPLVLSVVTAEGTTR